MLLEVGSPLWVKNGHVQWRMRFYIFIEREIDDLTC